MSAVNRVSRQSMPLPPVVQQRAYLLNGVTFLPHYQEPGLYVGPGYGKHNHRKYPAFELTMLGAEPIVLMLWERGHSKKEEVAA